MSKAQFSKGQRVRDVERGVEGVIHDETTVRSDSYTGVWYTVICGGMWIPVKECDLVPLGN